ncbi:MAG TPA: MBL fold metallo-hydrolase [Polyangiales bacterium]|nr:MBL fold metallo-hydrolase [Polyangiales bacterium]
MNDTKAPRLTFAGGAGTVTGSKHLVDTGDARILLDCGLFQGIKALRERNWKSPAFAPSSIDAVVLSHGHLDHTGYLPRLVQAGFAGPIICTPGTADLAAVVLRDSAHLQEEDAKRANRHRYSKHSPALPLYTRDDVEATLRLLVAKPYGQRFVVKRELGAMFRRAGHILGSATVELDSPASGRLVFSGDLGRWNRPILRDPELVPFADVLLVESTYGDRSHPPGEDDALERVITRTFDRRGVIVVPAFSIGRTQELIWTIRKLEDAGRIPTLPVYIDSPMAVSVTDIYCQHPEDHDVDMKDLMDEKRCPLCCRQYHMVRSADESKALNLQSEPMIIIAGSGMATGGRVVHHLKHRLPDPRNTVLLAGFQAAGTRGRALLDGAKEIKIHGGFVEVRAEIATVDGLSAHADQTEILRWLRGFQRPPMQTYVVHGEPAAAHGLASVIARDLGWSVSVAADGATVALPTGASAAPDRTDNSRRTS